MLGSYKHLHSYKDYTCNKTVMHITLSLSTHMKWILAIEIINTEYVTQDARPDTVGGTKLAKCELMHASLQYIEHGI